MAPSYAHVYDAYFARMCEAHKQEKLQGKYGVLEFVEDIFRILVCSNSKRRYSASTKSIYEMIKLFMDPRLHRLIILNMDVPSISMTIRKVRKSLTFLGDSW